MTFRSARGRSRTGDRHPRRFPSLPRPGRPCEVGGPNRCAHRSSFRRPLPVRPRSDSDLRPHAPLAVTCDRPTSRGWIWPGRRIWEVTWCRRWRRTRTSGGRWRGGWRRHRKTRQLTAIVERDGNGDVALCPEVDVASQRDSVTEARSKLEEALALFFETASTEETEKRLRTP